MKQSAGLWLIIAGLAALWLYNTGRLTAVLKVFQDPNYKPVGGLKQVSSVQGGVGYDSLGQAVAYVGGLAGNPQSNGGSGSGGGIDWNSVIQAAVVAGSAA